MPKIRSVFFFFSEFWKLFWKSYLFFNWSVQSAHPQWHVDDPCVILILFCRLQACVLLGHHKCVSFFIFSLFYFSSAALCCIRTETFLWLWKPVFVFFFPDFLLTWIVFVFCFPTLLEDGSKNINGFGPATSLRVWERRKNVSSFTDED